MRLNLPVSISELNYKKHNLFKFVMFFVVTFLIGKTYYISAALFAGVYVFRYFHMARQKYFHYGFAILGFASLAYLSGIYWPLVLGSASFMLNKVLHTEKEVFWFEMTGGLPYLFLI